MLLKGYSTRTNAMLKFMPGYFWLLNNKIDNPKLGSDIVHIGDYWLTSVL